MTVTAVHKDPDALTMTLTAEFDATPARVGAVGGSPPARALVGSADLPRDVHDPRPHARRSRRVPHDRVRTGDQPHGFWDILEVDPPRRLAFRDAAWRNADGTRNEEFPATSGLVTIEPMDAGRTRMSIESRFPSTEAMEQLLAMGMEEGLTMAVGQIDAILAEEVAA